MKPDPGDIVRIAELAGRAIMEVYGRPGPPASTAKADSSPLTEAHMAAATLPMLCRRSEMREIMLKADVATVVGQPSGPSLIDGVDPAVVIGHVQ